MQIQSSISPRRQRGRASHYVARARSVALVALICVSGATAAFQPAQAPPTLQDLERIAIADTMVMMPMRDGVRLATDIYRPRDVAKAPVIFIRTPYNFNKLAGFDLRMAYEGVKRGYAVVIQNERGRYYSEGEWEILGQPRTDGYDALSWLAAQDWSSGAVGTLGCSSSAEWQMALAAQGHPAHKAMVPMAAGAGIGRVGEFQEQGNWYKGGVEQTLFSVWLYSVQQNTYPRFPAGLEQAQLQRLRRLYDLAPDMPPVEWKQQLRKLPAIDWLEDAGANTGPMRELMMRKPNDPAWFRGGLYHDNEAFAVPALWFNSWFDVSQGPNLALFNHARERGTTPAVRDGQYAVVAPTLHCAFFNVPEHSDLVVGELNVGRAAFPVYDTLFGFLDHYLKGAKNGFPAKTPRVQYYTMGRNAWQSDQAWPPKAAQPVTLLLASDGHANSLFGDGRLVRADASAATPPASGASGGTASDSFTYDPMNPVPALGGGVCCNAGAALGGSYDQRGIAARADVLVYDSEPLAEPMEVSGFVRATLYVSSDAKDTDFTVKLVDVHPDGTAYNVDDTIQRARYREGYDREVFMQPGQVYELKLSPMTTSYQFKAGHRIRVEVASSKFPQYMRNLNTGGNNYDETQGVVAHNTLHYGPQYRSRIELPVVPVQDPRR